MLHIPGVSETLTAARLTSILRRSPPRLLVLEGKEGSFQPLLEIAHRVSAATGATIMVTEPESDEASQTMANETFYDIVHNNPLDAIARQLRRTHSRVALVGPQGSQDGLLLSRALGTVTSRRARVLEQTDRALEQLRKAEELGTSNHRYLERVESLRRELEEKRESLVAIAPSFTFD
jgi:hypothetical protein